MLEGEAEAPELAQAAPSPEGPADAAEAPAPSSSNSSGQGGSAQTASAAAAPEPVATSSGQPSSSGPSSPHSPAAEETRICFPFLNRGVCSFGAGCRFRHLAPDHPDAIADRVRTGHIFKIANVQDEKVQAQLQELTAATSPSAQALAPPTAASHDARILLPLSEPRPVRPGGDLPVSAPGARPSRRGGRPHAHRRVRQDPAARQPAH